ncbi:DUF2188 domain-containing protein [Pseudomonas viridiflava]|uniref:DUF2188 domain-containing protein n=1 Tax=Pseudomonas viridiflava TaxID=33069 RepID=UPI000F045EE6|nr:DUF2188 domain-containing protein [Pseudomonas viridiflava]
MSGKGKNKHVAKRGESRVVLGKGTSKEISHNRTQQEASDAARVTAQNERSEVLILDRDDKIYPQDSVCNDPHPSIG